VRLAGHVAASQTPKPKEAAEAASWVVEIRGLEPLWSTNVDEPLLHSQQLALVEVATLDRDHLDAHPTQLAKVAPHGGEVELTVRS